VLLLAPYPSVRRRRRRRRRGRSRRTLLHDSHDDYH